ncbi:hypothetical protein MMC14_009545 [Varicellaria rhodocarpa]|nr:hypothetical protein [Varicellaria rhodocarpa]
MGPGLLFSNAIASTPSVHWQVVVNPNSGPGPDTYPDPYYIAGIDKLNSYKNVETIGYVPTNNTHRLYSNVTNDIETYANWATYSTANLSVNGIFFDEAPSMDDAAKIQYMANASSFAYATIPTAATTVIFNPGVIVALPYFYYANTIIEFENSAAEYQNQTTINNFTGGGVKQSAVLVHNYAGTIATLQSLIHTGIANNLAGMYFTDDTNYTDVNIVGQVATVFAQG